MSEGQPLIRAKITNEITDFPHNDLENAAWFFRERLQKAFEAKDRPDGVFFDLIALVTMTSFALEGYVNALGWHWLSADAKAWKKFEWQPTRVKIEEFSARFGLTADWNDRPFSTVEPLIKLRNLFAHPKAAPAEQREQILDGRHNDFVAMLRDHKPEYERALTWEFANRAYEDVDDIWHTLLKASGIRPSDLSSGGSQGIELVGWVGPDGEVTPAP